MPIVEFRVPIYSKLPEHLYDGAFDCWIAPGAETEIGRACGYYFHDHTWHATNDHILGWSREIVHCLEQNPVLRMIAPRIKPEWLCGHAFHLVDDYYVRSGPNPKRYSARDMVRMAEATIGWFKDCDVTFDQWHANEHNQWLSAIQRELQLDGHWAILEYAQAHGFIEAHIKNQNHKNAIWHPQYPIAGPLNLSGIGQTYCNSFLNAAFQATTFTGAGTIYCALHSANPSDTSDGTESAYTGYARQTITCNSTNFPNASAGAIIYGVIITFPTNTGSSETETAISWQAASSGGTQPNWWGTLSSSVAVGNNIAPQLNANAVTTSGV